MSPFLIKCSVQVLANPVLINMLMSSLVLIYTAWAVANISKNVGDNMEYNLLFLGNSPTRNRRILLLSLLCLSCETQHVELKEYFDHNLKTKINEVHFGSVFYVLLVGCGVLILRCALCW